MKNDFTYLAFVIDESGSMANRFSDTVGGFNSLIERQRQEPGEVRVSLVTFNTSSQTKFWNLPIASVPALDAYNYRPGGGTALLDAVSTTIDRVGLDLAALPEEERPGHVIFVIQTDGEENSSLYATLEQVRQKIEHQQTKYSWEFVFLGEDASAFQAQQMGILASRTLSYDGTNKTWETYGVVSTYCSNTRAGVVNNSFTTDQQNSVK